jgi:hypothetical protein
MKKRLLLAILAALLLLSPAAYYGYYGLLRKEHFYWGLPTSFWAHRICAWSRGSDDTRSLPEFVYQAFDMCGIRYEIPLLLQGDDAAIPVLMDLLYEHGADDGAALFGLSCTPRFNELFQDPARDLFHLSVAKSGEYLVLIVGFTNPNVKSPPFSCTYLAEELVLTDRDGNVQDTVWYSVNGDLNCVFSESCKLVVDADPDTGEFLVRYVTENSSPACSQLRAEVEHYGQVFELGKGEYGAASRPCRFAVRNGRFEVLWPALRAAQ